MIFEGTKKSIFFWSGVDTSRVDGADQVAEAEQTSGEGGGREHEQQGRAVPGQPRGLLPGVGQHGHERGHARAEHAEKQQHGVHNAGCAQPAGEVEHGQLCPDALRTHGQRGEHAERDRQQQHAAEHRAPDGGAGFLQVARQRGEDAHGGEKVVGRVVHGARGPVAEHGVRIPGGKGRGGQPRAVQPDARDDERGHDHARHGDREHRHHAAETEIRRRRDEHARDGRAQPHRQAEHLLAERADAGGHDAHDAEQQHRRQHADDRTQPWDVRTHDQRVHRLDAGARAQPQEQHSGAAEQRDREHEPQKPPRTERAEILPQLLPGHVPRAEKAPGKRQCQPQRADLLGHDDLLPSKLPR